MNVRFMEAITVVAEAEGIVTAMEFIESNGYQVRTITYEDYGGIRVFAVRERQPKKILPPVTFDQVLDDYRLENANPYLPGEM